MFFLGVPNLMETHNRFPGCIMHRFFGKACLGSEIGEFVGLFSLVTVRL